MLRHTLFQRSEARGHALPSHYGHFVKPCSRSLAVDHAIMTCVTLTSSELSFAATLPTTKRVKLVGSSLMRGLWRPSACCRWALLNKHPFPPPGILLDLKTLHELSMPQLLSRCTDSGIVSLTWQSIKIKSKAMEQDPSVWVVVELPSSLDLRASTACCPSPTTTTFAPTDSTFSGMRATQAFYRPIPCLPWLILRLQLKAVLFYYSFQNLNHFPLVKRSIYHQQMPSSPELRFDGIRSVMGVFGSRNNISTKMISSYNLPGSSGMVSVWLQLHFRRRPRVLLVDRKLPAVCESVWVLTPSPENDIASCKAFETVKPKCNIGEKRINIVELIAKLCVFYMDFMTGRNLVPVLFLQALGSSLYHRVLRLNSHDQLRPCCGVHQERSIRGSSKWIPNWKCCRKQWRIGVLADSHVPRGCTIRHLRNARNIDQLIWLDLALFPNPYTRKRIQGLPVPDSRCVAMYRLIVPSITRRQHTSIICSTYRIIGKIRVYVERVVTPVISMESLDKAIPVIDG
nr:hypothetical protein Iba_chr02eCG2750 [Ipomoea batatas]